jgi:hypothetical protein
LYRVGEGRNVMQYRFREEIQTTGVKAEAWNGTVRFIFSLGRSVIILVDIEYPRSLRPSEMKYLTVSIAYVSESDAH